ncbi:serine protease [Marinicella sp. W31]|uniref:S1 family peptidase n=1 Tax=Marinicella sp. W31 TaxID=3023713 RepID=UPI003758175C
MRTFKLNLISFLVLSFLLINHSEAGLLDKVTKNVTSSQALVSKEIVASINEAEKKQQIVIKQAEINLQNASTKETEQSARLTLERSKEDLERLIGTRDAITNNTTPPPETYKVFQEIAVWFKRKVWVMCNGYPWMSNDEKGEYGNIIDKHKEIIRLSSLSVGRISTYDVLENEKLRLRQIAGTAIAIGENHIVTNKHVLLGSQLGYEDIAANMEMKLFSNIRGKVSFPKEYSNCKNKSSDVMTVELESIEYTHPELDFVVIKVEGDLNNFITFPNETNHVIGERIAVIGYTTRPADNETFLSPVQIDEIFKTPEPDGRTPFPVQRLSEGHSIDDDEVQMGYFRYDATTWGGNSGSIVLDLFTGQILGLHTRGLQSVDQGGGYNEAIKSEFVSAAISGL